MPDGTKGAKLDYGYRVSGGRFGYSTPVPWTQEQTNVALATVLRRRATPPGSTKTAETEGGEDIPAQHGDKEE